jgi:hypothetical protein
VKLLLASTATVGAGGVALAATGTLSAVHGTKISQAGTTSSSPGFTRSGAGAALHSIDQSDAPGARAREGQPPGLVGLCRVRDRVKQHPIGVRTARPSDSLPHPVPPIKPTPIRKATENPVDKKSDSNHPAVFADLIKAAGGEAKVDVFCSNLLKSIAKVQPLPTGARATRPSGPHLFTPYTDAGKGVYPGTRSLPKVSGKTRTGGPVTD